MDKKGGRSITECDWNSADEAACSSQGLSNRLLATLHVGTLSDLDTTGAPETGRFGRWVATLRQLAERSEVDPLVAPLLENGVLLADDAPLRLVARIAVTVVSRAMTATSVMGFVKAEVAT